MKVLIIQNCEIEGIDLFEQYLIDFSIDYETFHAYTNKRFPPINKYNSFIIGGTPISAFEAHKHNFLRKERIYLKKILTLNKPCIGICFGAQFMAMILGAQVNKNPVMEIGGYDVTLTPQGKKDPLFKEFPIKFPVFHWHGDTFSIPEGARLLAEGIDCKNQAFRYMNFVGLIFHLEVTCASVHNWADEYSHELKRVNKTKTQVINECKKNEQHMKTLARIFMNNFFERIKKSKRCNCIL